MFRLCPIAAGAGSAARSSVQAIASTSTVGASHAVQVAAATAGRRMIAGAAVPDFDIFNPTEDHRILRDMVRKFTESEIDPQAQEHDAREEFNLDLFRELGSMGLLGVTADAEFGGSGMDATAACIALEEMSAADPAFTLSYLAHTLLFVNNLNVNASAEQKAKFLPAVCSGQAVGGMCMSEPGAGTDVLGMSTTATKDANGDYVLNGAKMWITNGTLTGEGTGDIFLVYAKTGDKGSARDVSLFVLEKGAPGFNVGQKINNKCGMRASATAELHFDNVTVPKENLVGSEGDAALCMMRNLEIERIGLAAMSCGIARRSIEVMNAYAKERNAFGQPINTYGQIQAAIGTSYAEYMAGRTYTYNTANRLDLDSVGNGLDADGVKLFCGKMGKDVADRAIQVLGGNGYIGDYQVERLWRDAKLIEIGGGTNEAHQKNMVRDLKRNVTTLP